MALSYSQHLGDGSITQFPIDFKYISTGHITVYVDGVENTDYSFPSAYIVEFDTAPDDGAVVLLKRITPRDDVLVDFEDGSVLKESDLDLATLQQFYIAQEVIDNVTDKLSITEAGVYDALNTRIINVATPTSANDAVTKNYVDTFPVNNLGETITAKNEAVAAKEAAELILGDIEDVVAEIPQSNYTATTDPSTSNDVTEGYLVGSRWFNNTSKDSWVCIDNTEGAALWEDDTLTISDLGSMAIQEANNVNIDGGTLDGVVIGGDNPNEATFTDVTLGELTVNNGATVNENLLVSKAGTVYSIIEDSSGSLNEKKTALRMYGGGGQIRLLDDDDSVGDNVIAWNRTGSNLDILLLPIGKTHFHSNGTQMVASGGTGSVGAVGYFKQTTGGTVSYGDNVSGSDLVPGGAASSSSGSSMSGTWKCLGYTPNGFCTMFQRIS